MDRLEDALKRWAEAHKLADKNPELLLKDHARYSRTCGRRMDRLHETEDKLYSFECEQVPLPLRNWYRARENDACGRCWTSSTGYKHVSCKRKIERVFATDRTLLAYASKL